MKYKQLVANSFYEVMEDDKKICQNITRFFRKKWQHQTECDYGEPGPRIPIGCPFLLIDKQIEGFIASLKVLTIFGLGYVYFNSDTIYPLKKISI